MLGNGSGREEIRNHWQAVDALAESGDAFNEGLGVGVLRVRQHFPCGA